MTDNILSPLWARRARATAPAEQIRSCVQDAMERITNELFALNYTIRERMDEMLRRMDENARIGVGIENYMRTLNEWLARDRVPRIVERLK